MKNTKRISSHGSINIPVHLRRGLNMKPHDAFDVSEDGEGRIILTPHAPRCVICGGTERLGTVKGRRLCEWCAWEAMESRTADDWGPWAPQRPAPGDTEEGGRQDG